MAATDKPYRRQKTLDYVFAASCVLLLLSTLWMFVQDYNREFKSVQREFRDVETGLNERLMLDKMPAPDAVKDKQKAVADARKRLADHHAELADLERQLTAEREKNDNAFRTIKADYDANMSYYDILVEELGKAQSELTHARNADQKRAWAEKASELSTGVKVKEAALDRLRDQMNLAKNKLEASDRDIRENVTAKLADSEKKLSDAEDDLKKITGTFDRFAKVTAQRKWKFSDTIRALPILDGFESPTKIKQIVLPDLTIDYGGFREVPRYDRCTTCHLGIDRPTFTRAELVSLGETTKADQKLQQARELLQQRQRGGEDLGFDPADLPAKVLAVKLSKGQVSEYCAHPRLDLFVDSNSPHPAEKFGCTACHAGQGSATDFFQASHTPATYKEEKQWHEEYQWKSNHFWDFPMLSSRFVESTCLKCHHQVTDLIRHGVKEEAPKLLKGYNLLRENGCFGCHEIAGVKSGRSVGPDLRLEPSPALDLLTATEQEKVRSDPANPPGTYRKVGPALRRLAEKTNEVWTRKWLLSPRDFREDTRMPHFYGLSTNSPSVLPPEQKRFPDAEIHSIAHYLFTESTAYLKDDDTARKALLAQFTMLQNQLKESSLSLKERKELLDVTRRLVDLGLMSRPDRAADINLAGVDLMLTHDKLIELLSGQEKRLVAKESPADAIARLAQRKQELEEKGDSATEEEKKELARTESDLAILTEYKTLIPKTRELLDPQAARLLTLSKPVRLEDEIILGNGTMVSKEQIQKLVMPDAKSLEARRTNGRVLFTEKGCLACHSHDGTTKSAPNIAPVASEANFGPNLSRIAAKVAADPAGRRWLLQWILNPNVHFPRTRMPITHLNAEQAGDIGEWLLSQEVKDWTEKDPAQPERLTLVRLARIFLSKAPGMTMADVDRFLPDANADEADRAAGIPSEHMAAMAADADERELVSPGDNKAVPSSKLKWYIGKKSIGRLGCFGCHDIPGFETAKPIGTALNDWGKKDGERLAFEDSEAYVNQTFNLVDARDNSEDPSQPAKSWAVKNGKKPYEKYFLEMLEHHQRGGFLHLKLMDPRSFDYNRIRTWDDRLRMPQFQFSRQRGPNSEPQKPEESDEEFAARKKQEVEDGELHKLFAEARAREAVMTFVLGLVAEPVSLKYVYNPATDRQAVVKGRQVLEKFNCAGCHQVRPGVYEFKPTPGAVALLEENYKSAASQFGQDHPFASHNAWTGVPSLLPDRLMAFAVGPRELKKADNDELPEDLLAVRLSEALRFRGNDGVERDLPAAAFARVAISDLVSRSDPYGGAFAELLSAEYAPKRYPNRLKTPDDARSALPPPLFREGERVQPKWLYQFLLNPGPIRPEDYMLLRMPKFNMSPDDAKALVNYFAAGDKLGNPGIGLTYPYLAVPQREDAYWRQRTAEYVRRLGKDKVEAKVKAMKPVWESLVGEQLAEAKRAAESARAALKNGKPDLKADLEKGVAAADEDVKKLQEKLNKKSFADLQAHFESQEVYATDAFRLLTNRELCLKCHNIGSYKSAGAQGPNLELSAERLRPEWALEWIANPIRMFPYQPIMPVNFPRDKDKEYNNDFEGTSLDKIRAVRDVLLDLPRLVDLPGNRSMSAPAVANGGN